MNPCPDLSTLDDLSVDERNAHLASCSACRMLFSLRQGGDEEFGEDCEMAETLLAVACDTNLSAVDQRRLTKHLENCARCTALSSERLLWDDTAPAEEIALTKAWQPVAAYASPLEAANDQRSPLVYGIALLVAAAALILVLRGLSGSGEEEGSDSRAEPHVEQQLEAPRIEKVDPREADKSSIGASRPAPEVFMPPGRTIAELVEQSSEAIRNADYTSGLQLCGAALTEEPANQSALVNCAIAACNLKDAEAARTHIAGIANSPRKQGVTQICLRLGVQLDEEIDDVLDPNASLSELVEKSEEAVRSTSYRKGLDIAKKVLERDAGNQRALTAAAIAACNLKYTGEAKGYVAKVKSSQRRQGLQQVCLRLGVKTGDGEPVFPSPKVGEESIDELVEQAEAAVRNTQYGRGGRLCRQVLEIDPDNQRAMTACAIAACNLKNESTAKKYVRKIKSSQRRDGLQEVCKQLGVAVSD